MGNLYTQDVTHGDTPTREKDKTEKKGKGAQGNPNRAIQKGFIATEVGKEIRGIGFSDFQHLRGLSLQRSRPWQVGRS